MFKNPFSFEGRIRRMEYGISFIIYLVLYFTISVLTEGSQDGLAVIGFILLIPTLWFLWAQGAKRCHDIDRSGWRQIIPFYFLFLIFEDGQEGRNAYGSNPKFPDQVDVLESETLDGHLRN